MIGLNVIAWGVLLFLFFFFFQEEYPNIPRFMEEHTVLVIVIAVYFK